MEEKVQLGHMLVESSLLTPEQLKMAMDFQKSVGGKLGAIIVKLGFIEDQTLTHFIAKQQNIPVADLDQLVIPEILFKKLPRKMIEKHHVVPIRHHGDVLTIATSDPFDYEAMEEIQLALDQRIEVQLAPRTQILKVISAMFDRKPGAPPVREKSRDQLLRDLEGGGAVPSPAALRDALIPLLIQKGIITHDELARKARELESGRER